MKKVLFIFLFVLISLFFCSCEQTREIDEQSIVSAVCFNWKEKLTVSVEVLSVSIDEQNISTRVFSASGESPEKAFKALNNKLPKRLLFDHCAAIVLSPDMSDRRKKELLAFCIDDPTVNLSTPVIYSKNIESLLSAEHESAAVGYDIMQILRHNDCEKQSRLYKTAVDLRGILTFKNENGKVVKE